MSLAWGPLECCRHVSEGSGPSAESMHRYLSGNKARGSGAEACLGPHHGLIDVLKLPTWGRRTSMATKSKLPVHHRHPARCELDGLRSRKEIQQSTCPTRYRTVIFPESYPRSPSCALPPKRRFSDTRVARCFSSLNSPTFPPFL